jgi:hypothetical protein
MTITFDIKPEILKEYSTKEIKEMFDAFMFRIQQREKVLGKNFKR